MNDLVKNVLITSAIIGGIRLYGKIKYIQGIVDTNKALNEEFEECKKRRNYNNYNDYYTREGR